MWGCPPSRSSRRANEGPSPLRRRLWNVRWLTPGSIFWTKQAKPGASVEVRHGGLREVALERRVGTAGDVDRRAGARLVHRHQRVAVAGDAGAVAQRLVDRLAEHDARVLHSVMRACLEVALRLHVEVEP